MSLADNVSFVNFCQLCAKLRNAPKEKKVDILRQYISNWKKKGDKMKEDIPNLNDSFFPVLRLLIPQLDRERGAYGVKEHTLAKIYIQILSLPKDGGDAKKLLEYRTPKNAVYNSCDFAEVAFCVLKNRCGDGGEVSIQEINTNLDRIAAGHSSNDRSKVNSELVSLLTATSAEEQKWLMRILLKDVKIGLGQNAIFQIYHPDAKDLYEATNNLKKVCDTLKNVNIRLNEIQVELFAPFKPMLSEECDIKNIEACLRRAPYFFVETKLDGERFQLHMNEGNYKYFSRNGFDFTSNFGASIHEGSLTPRLGSRFQRNVKSCILDGEMMSWNTKYKKFSMKANNLDVKNLKDYDIHQPCFCVFDILLYNDEVLTNKPLTYRLEILQKIIEPLVGSIVFLDRKRISTKDEVIDFLNEAIDNREEGIIMKEFLCSYKPNVRKNGGWYKIKPEYTDGLSDTLDLLIIGGYYGKGRHHGVISHFLLGVADSDLSLFHSVVKVGSGYSMNELAELLGKLDPFWKVTKAGKMPPGIEWTKEKPDVWIEPRHSCILEIKAAEIMPSDLFKTGFTLRFPRVLRIRYDKSWESSLTVEEFTEKRNIASGKLALQHFTPTDKDEPTPKKKIRPSKLYVQNTAVDVSDITPISDLLCDKEICVFTGFNGVSRYDVERKIIEYGGIIVKNPGKKTFCVLAENDSTARIKNIIKCKSHDVIYTSWFFSQLHGGNDKLPELKPEHFLALSKVTRRIFKGSFDKYGDHFTQPVTREMVQNILQKISIEDSDLQLTSDDRYDMDVNLFGGLNPYNIFRNCTAYFDEFATLSDSTSLALPHLNLYKIDFRFRGGNCIGKIDDSVTHVVLHSKDVSRLKEINRINRKRETKFHVVTEEWVTTSINNGDCSNCSRF